MKTLRYGLMLLAIVSLSALATNAGAVSFSLTTVVDKDTPIPGGSGNFACLLTPAISNTKVVFWGSGFQPPFFCRPSGIYLFDGTALTKVADTNTAIPGGSGNFTEFELAPLISGSNVVFSARGSGDQRGIYLFDGSAIRAVADRNMAIPGGAGTFETFGPPVISGSNVAFFGTRPGGGGIYLFNGTTLTKVADRSTAVPPGGVATFSGFGAVAISGTNVVFDGFGPGFGQEGIYLFDGANLIAVADTSTAIPGGTGNFGGFIFEGLMVSGRNVTFKGLGSVGMDEGIYLFDGTTLSKVADTDTPIPDAAGPFTDFGLPVISGRSVAFLGVSEGQPTGLYLFDGTALGTVADTRSPVPDGTGTFTDFLGPAMSERNLTFSGRDSAGERAILLFNGHTLSVVANTKTPLPGGTSHFVAFAGPPAISGGNVAFAARGSGMEEGIYLATHELIGPAKLWVGLRNSDDVGLRVDLLAEVFKNDTLLASGQLDSLATGSSGFSRAQLRTIALSSSGEPFEFAPGDVLKLRLSVRRTCSGGGHISGAVRLWYGGLPVDGGKNRDAGTRFDARVRGAADDYFVRSGFNLDVTPESSRRFVDRFVDSKIACPDRPFLSFGTWSIALP